MKKKSFFEVYILTNLFWRSEFFQLEVRIVIMDIWNQYLSFLYKYSKKNQTWPIKLKLPFFGKRIGRLAKPGNSNIINQPVHHYLCKESSLGLNSRHYSIQNLRGLDAQKLLGWDA